MVKQETSAGYIIFFRENDKILYLILNHGKGYWNFPKGHVEENETLIETANRETLEETGLVVKQVTGFREEDVYSHIWKGEEIEKTSIYFLAESKQRKLS